MYIIFIILLLIIGLFVIGVGIGIAFVLRKLFSGLEIGMAIIASAIFSYTIIDCVTRLISSINESKNWENTENDDIDLEEPAIITRPSLWKQSKYKKKKRNKK